MAGLIYDLIRLINEQADCYDTLLQLAKEKSEFLLVNKLDEINNTTNKERAVFSKIQKIEKSRNAVMADIAVVTGQNKDSLTVQDLITMLTKQEDERDKLQIAAKKLRSLLDEVKEVNNKNNLLVQQSLDYIDYMLNVVHSSRDVQPPAYPNGQNGAVSRSMFDRKQ